MNAKLASSYVSTITGVCLTAFAATVSPEPAMADETLSDRTIGEVVTVRKLFGANHSIKITGFEDPKVDGVTCFLSRPISGGIAGSLGLAEDKSDASVACRQTGPITFLEAIENDEDGEEVFNESRSVWFKELHVSRFFDQASNSLVYLTWSDKLIDGSPKNAISAVTMMPWGTQAPGEPKLIQ